jgi:hypothetical protein
MRDSMGSRTGKFKQAKHEIAGLLMDPHPRLGPFVEGEQEDFGAA